MTKRFESVDAKVSFPELERGILAFWKDRDVFARSLAQREGAPAWIFYEGPPTANGKPGVHHVESRTFKDIYPRYKTMTGYRVPRKGGWDCHGLPVEIEVEKEIGTKGKRDIEAFGIAEFNERCRVSVQRYVGEWERLTERIGFWIDLSDAYWTMSADYIESVWWSLKRLHERGLLVEADKVTAYCPRCGTALSDAEVALGYRTVDDPSVFLRFPLVEAPDPTLVGASLVVWTTTPWTLPSNTGAAVAADAEYVVVEVDGERLIVAAALREPAIGEGARSSARSPARTWWARGTSRRSPTSRTRMSWWRPSSSRWTTAPASCTWRPRSGPRTSRWAGRRGGRSTSPWATTAGSPTRHPSSCAARSSRTPTRRSSRTCANAACCSARRPTNTTTRSAGDARRRSSTTRGRRGTPAPPP